MKPRQRGRILMRAADLLLSRADEFGKVETHDNGKPIFEAAKIDMPAAAECLSYFGEYADKLYGDTLPRPHRRVPPDAARAGRRRRRDHAVELPAPAGHVEDRARRSRSATRSS